MSRLVRKQLHLDSADIDALERLVRAKGGRKQGYYFRPNGQPVEYWLRVLVRYHLAPRRLSAVRPIGLMRRMELKPRLRAVWYLGRLGLMQVFRKGVRVHG